MKSCQARILLRKRPKRCSWLDEERLSRSPTTSPAIMAKKSLLPDG
jgi:hypothetical protein